MTRNSSKQLMRLGTWMFRMVLFVLALFCVMIVAFELYNPYTKKQAGVPNSIMKFENDKFDDLPREIVIKFNNIGWIGSDYSNSLPPARIFFIGSSTTQNIFITSPLARWHDVAMAGLPHWYNNAGLKGTGASDWAGVVSSIEAYRPSHVVLLVTPFLAEDLHTDFLTSTGSIKNRLLKLDFMRSVVLPYYMTLRPKQADWGHAIDWNTIQKDTSVVADFDSVKALECLQAIEMVVEKIKQMGAQPILISQPNPFGNYVYRGVAVNEIYYARYEIAAHAFFAAGTRAIAAKQAVPFIDGYGLMPRSFDYYFDQAHFNTKGSKLFGQLIRDSLQAVLTSSR